IEQQLQFAEWHAEMKRQLFWPRIAAEARGEIAASVRHLCELFDCVHGEANVSHVISDCATDGLTNPPGRIRRELEASSELKAINGLHQAARALLDPLARVRDA